MRISDWSSDVCSSDLIMLSVSALKHAKKHMAAWAKGERRKPTFPLGLLGAKAEVVFQPKGVVGVVSPWNFPIGMVFVPMARSDERRVGTECVSPCRSRRSPSHYQKNQPPHPTH